MSAPADPQVHKDAIERSDEDWNTGDFCAVILLVAQSLRSGKLTPELAAAALEELAAHLDIWDIRPDKPSDTSESSSSASLQE